MKIQNSFPLRAGGLSKSSSVVMVFMVVDRTAIGDPNVSNYAEKRSNIFLTCDASFDD